MKEFGRNIGLKQLFKNPWLLILFVFSSLLYYTYLNHFSGSITTDSNSALSLLTTIVQSEATIIAIVISLSIVVIQHYASSYSSRVVDILVNDKKLWRPILLYGISIISSLCLIRWINPDNKSFNLEILYSLILSVSIIAHIILINSVSYFLKLMKPNSIIDILAKKITVQSLTECCKSSDERPSKISKYEPRIDRTIVIPNNEKDPILPIIDIVNASIVRYDYDTVEHGLQEVFQHYFDILLKSDINETQVKEFSEHTFNRTFKVYQLALNKKDFNSIDILLEFYFIIGRNSTYLLLDSNPSYIDHLLKHGSKILTPVYNALGIQKEEEEFTQKSILYVTFLSELYIKEAFESIVKVKDDNFSEYSKYLVTCVHDIGKSAINALFLWNRDTIRIDKQIRLSESIEGFVSELSCLLGSMGVAAINSDSKSALNEVVLTLNDIGEDGVDNNLIHSIPYLLKNLWIIGKESPKKGVEIESSTVQIIKCLENLASKIDYCSEELSGQTQPWVVEYYKHIKSNYYYDTRTKDPLEELQQKVNLNIRSISGYIASIGENAVENNLLVATKQCLKSLEIIERILGSGTQARIICQDIENLGQKAVNKEETFSLIEDIIKTLYSIGILYFGYLFEWDIDKSKIIKFLNEEYSTDLDKEDSFIYFAGWLKIIVKDKYDSNPSFTLEITDENDDDENALVINNVKNKNIKAFHLKDIEGKHFVSNLKIFKTGVIEKSEKAYYEIPNSLGELADPILKYAQNSPTFETIKPFIMIIKCFENFANISIHLRDKSSLNDIFIPFLFYRADFLVYDLKYSEDDKAPEAEECLYWMVEEVFESLYKLAILSLEHNLIECSTLRQLVESLKRLKKKYPYMSRLKVDEFEEILEVIKRSELKKPEWTEIIKLIENTIEEFKNKEED